MRHLNRHFLSRLTCPETDLSKLGQDHVESMLESTLVAGTRIHYWHKNIGKVVEHAVSPYIVKWNSIDSADVLVGADHGQGKSCAGVGMLMWSGNQCVIDEV